MSRVHFVATFALAAATLASAEMARAAEAPAASPIATIGTQVVTRAEIETRAAEGIEQAELAFLQAQAEHRRQLHEVFENTARQVVQERILDQEAAARGINRDQLFEAEVVGKAAPVTDADVDRFYDENRARIGNATKEQIAPQIRQYLGQQAQVAAFETLISGLEAKYAVKYNLEPYRAQVEATPSSPAKGASTSAVTIVEFSDFQCPVCAMVLPTLQQVQEKYGDKVRLVFRQFPLESIHPDANKAAEASLCAHEQGKFWPLHDAMFADQQGLAVDKLKEKAKASGLDGDKFAACLDSGKHAEAVQQDLKAGVKAGVGGTPTFFVNGRPFVGAVPFADVAKAIDEELAKTSTK